MDCGKFGLSDCASPRGCFLAQTCTWFIYQALLGVFYTKNGNKHEVSLVINGQTKNNIRGCVA